MAQVARYTLNGLSLKVHHERAADNIRGVLFQWIRLNHSNRAYTARSVAEHVEAGEHCISPNQQQKG